MYVSRPDAVLRGDTGLRDAPMTATDFGVNNASSMNGCRRLRVVTSSPSCCAGVRSYRPSRPGSSMCTAAEDGKAEAHELLAVQGLREGSVEAKIRQVIEIPAIQLSGHRDEWHVEPLLSDPPRPRACAGHPSRNVLRPGTGGCRPAPSPVWVSFQQSRDPLPSSDSPTMLEVGRLFGRLRQGP